MSIAFLAQKRFRFVLFCLLVPFVVNSTVYGAIPSPEPTLSSDSISLVHIQDAHSNPTAQEDIANLLSKLQKNQGIDLVFVEGAIGSLDARYLRFSKNPALNLKVAEKLARMGELSGTDLYLLRKGTPKLHFFGIEDRVLYRKNLELFQRVMKEEEVSWRWIRGERERLVERAVHLNNKELLELVRHKIFFEREKRDLKKFVSNLNELFRKYLNRDMRHPGEQKEFPNLLRLLTLIEEESKVDVEKAMEEWEEIKGREASLVPPTAAPPGTASLKREASTVELDKLFLRDTLHEIRDTRTNPRFLLEKVYFHLQDRQFDFRKYPEFSRLARIRTFQYELKSPDLFREIDAASSRLLKVLARTKAEKEIVREAKEFVLKAKLLVLQLERKEWEGIKNSKLEIRNSKMRDAFSFYQTAESREKVFVKHILAILKERKKSKAIVITGGFHTEGLRRQFEKYPISHSIKTPRLSGGSSRKIYVNSLLGKYQDNIDLSKLAAVEKALDFEVQGQMDPEISRRVKLYKLLENEVRQETARSLGVDLGRLAEMTGFSRGQIESLDRVDLEGPLGGMAELILWAVQMESDRMEADKMFGGLLRLFVSKNNRLAPPLPVFRKKELEFEIKQRWDNLSKMFKRLETDTTRAFSYLRIFWMREREIAGKREVYRHLKQAVSRNSGFRAHRIFRALENIFTYRINPKKRSAIQTRIQARGFLKKSDAVSFIDRQMKRSRFADRFRAFKEEVQALEKLVRETYELPQAPDKLQLRLLRAKLVKEVQPFLDFLSRVSESREKADSQVERPDLFFVITNPDIRTYVKLARLWKSFAFDETDPVEIPIVIAGGIREGGKDHLIHRAKAYYRTEIPEEVLKQFSQPETTEAEIVQWILGYEGIPQESLRLEKESSNTPESFRKGIAVIAQAVGGLDSKKLRVRVVTCPPLNLRVHLTALKQWEGLMNEDRWRVITHPIYPPESYHRFEDELLELLGYVLGYPKGYKPGQSLNRLSELERIAKYGGKRDPDLVPFDFSSSPWNADKIAAIREGAFLRYLELLDQNGSAESLGSRHTRDIKIVLAVARQVMRGVLDEETIPMLPQELKDEIFTRPSAFPAALTLANKIRLIRSLRQAA